MKFTQADKDFFAAVRQEDPAVDQLFKDIRAVMECFPGTKIKHLEIRGSEWGSPQPEGEPYVPLPRPETIPNGKKQQQRAMTAGEKRRAQTIYK